MRVLLCGYHEAGYRALRILIAAGHEALVATHEAPPELPSVTALARSFGVRTVIDDPAALKSAAVDFAPDVVVSMYYRHILSPDLLSLARIGAVNFHPSLLPKHRGCFSAPWAIIDGDSHTGVTCHVMTCQVDAGDIVGSTIVPIGPDETGISLFYRLADSALGLFERLLDPLESGDIQPTPQCGTPTHHSRKVPFDGLIDRSWPREKIDRFIRAMFFPPYPPAAVMLDGVRRPVRSLAEYDDRCEKSKRAKTSAFAQTR